MGGSVAPLFPGLLDVTVAMVITKWVSAFTIAWAVFGSTCCFGQATARLSLTDLIKQVEPAVVRIDVSGRHGKALGSGFVVGAEGVVVTNHHVMAGSMSAKVTFQDGKKARVLGTLVLDAERDIAVIQIEKGQIEKRQIEKGKAGKGGYPALPLASQLPIKGVSVVAFGAPLGLSFSATEGIVSSIRSAEELEEYSSKIAGTWVQTSTPISPGNSGGPLVNLWGEVVGANTMGMMRSQNLNFAISSIDILDAVKQAKGKTVVALSDGAAKEEQEVPISMLAGAHLQQAVEKLADLMLSEDADSRLVQAAAQALLRLDPHKISSAKVRSKVAKGFKRLAFESKFYSEEGVRGMSRWGGKHSIPYLAELLEIETFHGSEAIYKILSQSDDPRASKAIARRLGNFFDRKRALAALRRMGPVAEPGLILAVSDGDVDACLAAIYLLSEHGTSACVPMMIKASKKGVPVVRVAAKKALTVIRTRQRKAAREAVREKE